MQILAETPVEVVELLILRTPGHISFAAYLSALFYDTYLSTNLQRYRLIPFFPLKCAVNLIALEVRWCSSFCKWNQMDSCPLLTFSGLSAT